MTAPLRLLTSMASKDILAALVARYPQGAEHPVTVEAIGGVDAARRIAEGQAYDLVVLAAGAIDKLTAEGHLRPGSRRDLAHSSVAAAVPAGAPHPDLSNEDSARAALLAAPSVGYSTGPSGNAIAQLLARWGLADALQARIVIPPPGTPVGSLIARGDIALGFQQRSELINQPGIELIDALTPALQITTTFSAAIPQASAQPAAAARLIDYLAAPESAECKRAHGMVPA